MARRSVFFAYGVSNIIGTLVSNGFKASKKIRLWRAIQKLRISSYDHLHRQDEKNGQLD